MNDLLLTFSQKQYEEYLKIKEAQEIELDFDTEIERISPSSDATLRAEITKMLSECEKLLAIQKQQKVFASAFSRQEIERLIPIFYTVIGKIDHSKRKLYQESITIVKRIEQAERICADVYARYSSFLPYKAALFERKEYSERIATVDNEFKSSISLAKEQKANATLILSKISSLCDSIIPEFFKALSHASDAPKFEGFNPKEFFFALDSFIEKIRNI